MCEGTKRIGLSIYRVDLEADPAYVYAQWLRSSPAACWAIAFAVFMTMGPAERTVSPVVGLAGLALAILCSIKQVFEGIDSTSRALSGFGCILLALVPWKGPAVSFLARFGRYGYGIFLCHPVIVDVARIVRERAHIAPSAPIDLLTFAVSLTGALALSAAFAKTPRLAWLNG